MQQSTTETAEARLHSRWNARLLGLVAVLAMVSFVADAAISAPLVVLPEMLDHFDTDQAGWLNASATLAGVAWSPLLGKSADIYGRRRILVLTLFISCAGALLCAVAPTIWVFVPGRMLQGAALAAVFLSVAIVRSLCAPRIGMIVVGIVTSGSAVLNIASRFLIEQLANEYGFQILFVLAACVAAAMALFVHVLIPESLIKTPGTIDFSGAVLLGGGLAGVLSYISLGSGVGWLSAGPLALLIGGIAALTWWYVASTRKPDPLIDVRNLGKPLALTLLVVALGAGAFQSMLQLISLISDVSPDERLGYGLAGEGSIALLLGSAGLGIMFGGPLAGWLAARLGPIPALAGVVVLGTVVTIGMFLGASQFAIALFCSLALGVTAGALLTSGFNTAGTLASAERQGVVSGLIMVSVSIGSVVLDFVGAAVLTHTHVVVDGETSNSATGVYSYVVFASGAFTLATVLVVLLWRAVGRNPHSPSVDLARRAA
ncbi:MFS transporter [Cryptosporangium arvum]|uniref:MFS transporter n=1 Tax=Cryptosporangium arvum TaxID=80871 RepID=UPI000567DC67|nr:MFS transporter [Cryptosporangium arvum]